MEKKRIPKRRFREFLEAGEWEETVFNDTFDTNVGNNTLSREQLDYNEGSIRNIHYGDVLINFPSVVDIEYEEIPRIMCEYEKHISKSQLLKNGDIVMADTAEDDTVGKAIEIEGIKDDYVVAGLHTIVCRPKHKVAQNYFGYAVNAPAYHKQLIPLMQGTKVTSINKSALGETIIRKSLEIEEQAKIGNFCRRLDTLISLHQQKLSKLKDLKQAYLTEMLPAPGKKRPRRRFKGFSGDWEKVVLGDIVNFLDGQRRPLEAGERKRGIYPYYGATGIIDYVDGYLFSGENILLSEDGANIIDRNYRVCFLADGKYWVNNHAHVMNAHSGYVNGFICEALERLDYTSYNTGTAQPKLNQDVCRKIELLVPSYDEQKNIYGFLNTIDVTVIQLKTKLAKLQSLKQAYLSELFV